MAEREPGASVVGADTPFGAVPSMASTVFETPDRPLALEKAVELEVNGANVAILMCTPYDLDLLAYGYLLTSGMIDSLDDILSMWICPDDSRVSIRCARDPLAPAKPGVTPSACGAGPISLFHCERAPAVPRGEVFPMESLREWAREVFKQATLHREMGGVHCAALADRDGVICVYEDVGRHNAMDKAIGRGLAGRMDFSRCCLISSGRIAADMTAKAIIAGIPVIASRSIPTTAAYAMAVEKGLTMIGRVSSPSPIVYTMRDRLS